jgi:hypothetical protein
VHLPRLLHRARSSLISRPGAARVFQILYTCDAESVPHVHVSRTCPRRYHPDSLQPALPQLTHWYVRPVGQSCSPLKVTRTRTAVLVSRSAASEWVAHRRLSVGVPGADGR